MANEKLVQLDSKGPNPEVEMIIGQPQWGKYVIDLWDPPGIVREDVGAGLNVDHIPDKFTINHTPAELHKSLLSWEVKVASFSNSPGQLYSVTVKITQAGNICPGGLLSDSGALNNAIYLHDFVRFITT